MSRDHAFLEECWRRMLRIRRFEEAVVRLKQTAEIAGACHVSIGQEAETVGACMALRTDDAITGTHRSHGHPIAKGAALGPLMAELFGRSTGICKGKGGSMHLADFSVGCIGETAIVGSGLPVAVGAGLSAQQRGTDQVVLAFFGDGASNTGAFHEALNLAAVWSLPVVFHCENNQYALTTAWRDAARVDSVARRADAYGMTGVSVDGQDLLAVHAAVADAAARARTGKGPTLVEARTYRFRDHSEFGRMNLGYRTEDEIAQWRARDPLVTFPEWLVTEGGFTEDAVDAVEAEVEAEVQAAITFARSSPYPDADAVFEDLWATPFPHEVTTGMREITYLQAITEALREEMARDERVVVIGEDARSPIFASGPLVGEFPADRIRNTPISEGAIVGAGVGAAMTGLRPVVDLTIASLVYCAMDQIVNQAAKNRYLFGGQASVPLVVRSAMLFGGAAGAQHSDRPYPMFVGVPGLKVIVPATPGDVKGMLKAAIRDDDPVLCFEDSKLWGRKGPVPDGDHVVPLGRAVVVREGDDVTVVTIGSSRDHALDAAEALAPGASVEVVDVRSLVPLDRATIIDSVAKTGRLVVADPAHRGCSMASEIAAIVAEEAFPCLRAPVVRVTAPDVQVPFSVALERDFYPTAARIGDAVRQVLEFRFDRSEERRAPASPVPGRAASATSE